MGELKDRLSHWFIWGNHSEEQILKRAKQFSELENIYGQQMIHYHKYREPCIQPKNPDDTHFCRLMEPEEENDNQSD